MFSKKAVFSEKTVKTRFRGPSLFWKKRGVWRWKWIKPFLWEMRFWIFFHLTIFSKKATFSKKKTKKIFWRTKQFFSRWGHLQNIVEILKNGIFWNNIVNIFGTFRWNLKNILNKLSAQLWEISHDIWKSFLVILFFNMTIWWKFQENVRVTSGSGWKNF